MAPLAAWIAVTGSFPRRPASLRRSRWVAGFDIIYSLQDGAFDRARGSLGAGQLGSRQASSSRRLHAAARPCRASP
jgi:4-hydroxybenzoate polyprenyltransferase